MSRISASRARPNARSRMRRAGCLARPGRPSLATARAQRASLQPKQRVCCTYSGVGMAIQIQQEQMGTLRILGLSGRLDTETAVDVELALQDLLAAGERHFLLDLGA